MKPFKHNAAILLLFFTSFLFAQSTKIFTKHVSGSGNANGGKYDYRAKLKFQIYNAGLGDIVLKVGIMDYKITNFFYKGITTSVTSDYDFKFPIVFKNHQADVSGTVKLVYGAERQVPYNFKEDDVRQGALDIHYFSKEDVDEIVSDLGLKTNSDRLITSRWDMYDIQINNSYFSELSTIASTIDKREANYKKIRALSDKLPRNPETKEDIKRAIRLYKQLAVLDPKESSNYKDKIQELNLEIKNIENSEVVDSHKESENEDIEDSSSRLNESEPNKEKTKELDINKKTIDITKTGSSSMSKKPIMSAEEYAKAKVFLDGVAYKNKIKQLKAYGYDEGYATTIANIQWQDKNYSNAAKSIGNSLGSLIYEIASRNTEKQLEKFEYDMAKIRSTSKITGRSYCMHKINELVWRNNTNDEAAQKTLNTKEENINEVKQQILQFVVTSGNRFVQPSLGQDFQGDYERAYVLQQKIDDVYFEGYNLVIEFTQKIVSSMQEGLDVHGFKLKSNYTLVGKIVENYISREENLALTIKWDSGKTIASSDFANIAEFKNKVSQYGIDFKTSYYWPVKYGKTSGLFLPDGLSDIVWHLSKLEKNRLKNSNDEDVNKDKNDWELANKENTIKSFENYLANATNILYRKEAKRKLNNLNWNKIKQSDNYTDFQDYLNNPINTLYRNQALKKVEFLKPLESFEALSKFLNKSQQNLYDYYPTTMVVNGGNPFNLSRVANGSDYSLQEEVLEVYTGSFSNIKRGKIFPDYKKHVFIIGYEKFKKNVYKYDIRYNRKGKQIRLKKKHKEDDHIYIVIFDNAQAATKFMKSFNYLLKQKRLN